MITIQSQVSGAEIARELKDDPEELGYALDELTGVKDGDLQVAVGMLTSNQVEAVKDLARRIIAAAEVLE